MPDSSSAGERPVGDSSSPRGRVHGLALVAGLAVVTAVLVGLGVVLGQALQSPQEAALRAVPSPTVVTDAVTREVVERRIVTRGTLRPLRTITVTAAGASSPIVTAVEVAEGATVTAGEVLLEVTGRPVIVLQGQFPAWRDFRPDMPAGVDVSQLQRALTELALYDGPIDGRYGRRTGLAVEGLYELAGSAPPEPFLLPSSEVVFLPQGEGVVEAMGVQVGDTLASGDVVVGTLARRIEVELNIDQRDELAVGDRLEVRTESGGTALETTVAGLQDISGDGDRVRTAIVPDGRLPTDLATSPSVHVEVILEATDGPVLTASPAAVHRSEDGAPYVIVAADGEPRRVAVEVGLVGDRRVEILPGEGARLESRDELVLNPDALP